MFTYFSSAIAYFIKEYWRLTEHTKPTLMQIQPWCTALLGLRLHFLCTVPSLPCGPCWGIVRDCWQAVLLTLEISSDAWGLLLRLAHFTGLHADHNWGDVMKHHQQQHHSGFTVGPLWWFALKFISQQWCHPSVPKYLALFAIKSMRTSVTHWAHGLKGLQ